MTVKEKWKVTKFHNVEKEALNNIVEFIVGALKDRLIHANVIYKDNEVTIKIGKEYDR